MYAEIDSASRFRLRSENTDVSLSSRSTRRGPVGPVIAKMIDAKIAPSEVHFYASLSPHESARVRLPRLLWLVLLLHRFSGGDESRRARASSTSITSNDSCRFP